MKLIGIFALLIAIFVLFFLILSFIQKPEKDISPILEDDGVKVIYETPTK